MTPIVSVVIPTYQRPQLLRRCLEALIAQNFDLATCEIVVVDDARSAATRDQIKAFARQYKGSPSFLYLRPPPGKRGPAAARNTGWQAANAEIIAFTDDDTIPAANWLRHGLAAMEPGVAAAWGHVVVPLPAAPTDAERNTGGLHGAEFITANCFVRRAVLAGIGGFDERFTRAWREDSDLYFTLLEGGRKVVGVPSAVVTHPARPAPVVQCLHQHRNLFFDALLYKKHRRLYREKIAATPPLRYYLAVALLIFALGALVAGQPAMAMTALAGWLVLTLYLALRRLRGISRAWREQVGIALTSVAIPPLAVFWRLAGAWHFRVPFA